MAQAPDKHRVHAKQYGGNARDVEIVVPSSGKPEPFVIDLR